MIKIGAIICLVAASVFAAFAGGQTAAGFGDGLAAVALPTPQSAAAEVCSDPAANCDHKRKHFDEWELPFKMPAKLTPNKTYRSAPFYAVMLKTFEIDDDCDGGEYVIAVEKERKKVQKTQATRKVFAEYQCPNMGAVGYDFEGRMDAKRETVLMGNFIAVYAGTTRDEADKLLATVKAKYPDAVVKKMTANFEVIEQ